MSKFKFGAAVITVCALLSTSVLATQQAVAEHMSQHLLNFDLDQTSRRLAYAQQAFATGHAEEAYGALRAIMRDNPIEASHPLFLGLAARVSLANRRYEEALTLVSSLRKTPDICAIIVISQDKLERPFGSISDLECALGVRAHPQYDMSRDVRLAAAKYYLGNAQPDMAIRLLSGRDPNDIESLYYVSFAQMLLGQLEVATQGFMAGARHPGEGGLMSRVRLAEIRYKTKRATLDQTLDALDKLRYDWRGGDAERLLHETILRLAMENDRPKAALASAASLVRYFPRSPHTVAHLQTVQSLTIDEFGPKSDTPMIEMLDTYWSYRDLLPPGPIGDEVGRALARRLALSGLYNKAAQVYEHQARHRMVGPSQPYMANMAAAYYILAGQPGRAENVLKVFAQSEGPLDVEDTRRALMAVAALRAGNIEKGKAIVDSIRSPFTAFKAAAYWTAEDYEAFLQYSANLEYAFGSNEARELALMRAAALTRTGRSALDVAVDAEIAPALNLLQAPADKLGSEDLRRAMAAMPKFTAGDRLLALALGCSKQLSSILECSDQKMVSANNHAIIDEAEQTAEKDIAA